MKPWEQTGFFLGEESFLKDVEERCAPFIAERYQDISFEGTQGRHMHGIAVRHPNPCAAVVISHGFCEFVHKYDELIYYLYQLGYSVYFVEHLGHSYSHRLVSEPDRVHLEEFEDYVNDLKCFMDQIVMPETDCKKLLFAHSMGGAIGARFLEEYPGYFKAAVLSSPMMQMNTGKFPGKLLIVLSNLMRLLGKSENYVPGKHGFDHQYVFDTSSVLSEPRYRYVFDYRERVPEFTMYGATFGWMRACLIAEQKIIADAKKVDIPVLLFQAGRDTMVCPEGQNLFASAAGNATVIVYPDSKHEIYNAMKEDRESFFREVFAFFEHNLEDEK